MTITTAGGTGFHLQGLSTDDKPLEDVQDGSTFHAVDTGEMWVFHNGMWETDRRLVKALESLF
jgi:hypothetical protein